MIALEQWYPKPYASTGKDRTETQEQTQFVSLIR